METTAQRLAAPILLVTTAQTSFADHPAPNGDGVHPMLGRLIQPRHFSSIEETGAAGIPWAADNDCFQGLDPAAYELMLDRIAGVPGCLFVTVPDVVGDAQATAELFDTWAPELERRGLPLALVLQDGVENLEWLDGVWSRLAAVFVGGTDEFKLGPVAAELAREAKRRGLWVHWGRVNSRKRFRYIAETGAADSCDGSPWATLRLAAVNQRTIDRAIRLGRPVPAAVRKLDQGLAWLLEIAHEAAAQITPAPRRVLPIAGGSVDAPTLSGADLIAGLEAELERRGIAPIAGGSQELDELPGELVVRRAGKAWTCEACSAPIARGELHLEYLGETPAFQSGSRYCAGCARRVWHVDVETRRLDVAPLPQGLSSPVLDIRLTALADAIRGRDWTEVERQYDRVRSTLERELGVRNRPADRLRAEAELEARGIPPIAGGSQELDDSTPPQRPPLPHEEYPLKDGYRAVGGLSTPPPGASPVSPAAPTPSPPAATTIVIDRKTLRNVIAVVVAVLVLAYAGGIFDKQLAPYGLNAHTCYATVFGTACGKQAEAIEKFRDSMKDDER